MLTKIAFFDWQGTWNSALTQGLKDQGQGAAAGGSSDAAAAASSAGAAAATGGGGQAAVTGGATEGAIGQEGSPSHAGAGGEVESDCVLAHFVHVPGGATNKLTVKMAQRRYVS